MVEIQKIMQQNESITSTDASVGKDTEQKTNENKDQPQSAQNNQTANEVKNDVKNVNSTDGTNQAATSTEEMLQKVLKLQHQMEMVPIIILDMMEA